MRRLEKESLITLKELFIDGTKMDANAKRPVKIGIQCPDRSGELFYHSTAI